MTDVVTTATNTVNDVAGTVLQATSRISAISVLIAADVTYDLSLFDLLAKDAGNLITAAGSQAKALIEAATGTTPAAAPVASN